jgi:hypothetical protein
MNTYDRLLQDNDFECGPIAGTDNLTPDMINNTYNELLNLLPRLIIAKTPSKITDIKRYYCDIFKFEKTLELYPHYPNTLIFNKQINDIKSFIKNYLKTEISEIINNGK